MTPTVAPTVPVVDQDAAAQTMLTVNAADGVLAGATDPAASEPLSVSGFNPSQDVLSFNSSLFQSYPAVHAATTQVGNNVIIDSHGDQVTLVGVQASQLTQKDRSRKAKSSASP